MPTNPSMRSLLIVRRELKTIVTSPLSGSAENQNWFAN